MPRRDLFTGRSGQLALMAEFLIRQLNVAIPEVDLGDDIVVVRDDNDVISRVQVKTANAKQHANANEFSAQFKISLEQLEDGPENLVYAFVVRRQQRWEEFVLIRRAIVFDLQADHAMGSEDGKGNLVLPLSFSPNQILNKGLILQPFRARFDPWPPPIEIPTGVIPDNPL